MRNDRFCSSTLWGFKELVGETVSDPEALTRLVEAPNMHRPNE